MSTNGMTSWAVDLADVTAIYPFQGSEVLMYIIGLAFWIIWHVIQMRQEAEEIGRETDADRDGSHTKAWIEKY